MHNNTATATTNGTLSRHRFRPFSPFTNMFKNHRRNGKRKQRATTGTTSTLDKNGGKKKRNVKRSQDVSIFDTLMHLLLLIVAVNRVFFIILYFNSSMSNQSF